MSPNPYAVRLGGLPVVVSALMRPGQAALTGDRIVCHSLADAERLVRRMNHERETRAVADAFLADIVANPADDTPRLVYADWLDDRGDGARAEFIRVQCELAGPRNPRLLHWGDLGDHENCPCRHCRLRRRERELLVVADMGRDFLLGYRPQLDLPAAGVGLYGSAPGWCYFLRYRRGFVACITCTLADWLAHGPALVRAAPLEEVRVSDRLATTTNQPAPRGWVSWAKPYPDEDANQSFMLPVAIFAKLRRDPGDRISNTRSILHYPTQAAAEAALSAAALAWAHEKGPPRS